jgi:hypothetical protein
MTRRSRMVTIIAAAAMAGTALAARGIAGSSGQPGEADPALLVFHERVQSYADLHRSLAPPFAAEHSRDAMARLLKGRDLAAAIRSARPDATQGDIFTPAAAAAFRHLLADSIGERDGETFLMELNGGNPVPRGMHPTVNEPYTMTTLYRLPGDVQMWMPPIPPELDYRIAAHDLVLWDVSAGIIVDFMPDALWSPVTTE